MATLYLVILGEADAIRLEIRRRWLAGESPGEIMKALGVNVMKVLQALVGVSKVRA